MHRGHVYKDGRCWVGTCTCTKFFTSKKWSDTFSFIFGHVVASRRIDAIGGVGFGMVKHG